MKDVYRKEIKYVVSLTDYLRISDRLDLIMKRDEHGNRGTYQVRSLYFDSISDQDLWDNFSGVMEKRKIRLRMYSAEDKNVKLEYKCKSGSDGRKYSILLTKEEAMRMEKQEYEVLLRYPDELSSFLYVKMSQNLYRPRTIVEYQRTAHTYPVSDVRITFDHRLRGSATPYGFFEKEPFLLPLMNDGEGILEVKYNDFLPSPIKSIISDLDQLAEARSKYSESRRITL